jgi:hypothetical protein
MAATVEIIIKTIDQSTKETKEAKAGLDDIVKAAGIAAASLAAFGIAAKQAFDLGAEGAALSQLSESFDGLESRLGLQIDLRKELEKAARGTIATSELEASALTLLAGTSGDLEQALGGALPQLLEIAKAANKVNPALGDTSFLFDSLARGIKRSSPLILDNLGLVIKIGEVNETAAEKLGKTVEQLTAEEKQMALLNATIAAGGTLIEQAGGNVDSLTDSYAKLEATVKNTADEMKQSIGDALRPAVDAFNETREAEEILEEALAAGVITQKEYNAESFKLSVSIGANEERMQELTSAIDMQNRGLARADELMLSYGDTTEETADSSERLARLNEEVANSIEEIRKQAPEPIVLFDEVDPGIASSIDNMRKDIEFMLAGGLGLQQEFAEIKRLTESGNLSLEAAAQLLEDAKLEAIAIQVSMGEMTVDEAVLEAVEDLSISAEDARAAIVGFGQGLDILDGKQIQTSVINTIHNVVVGQGGAFGGTGASAAAGIEAATAGPTGQTGTPASGGNADVVAAIEAQGQTIMDAVGQLAQ